MQYPESESTPKTKVKPLKSKDEFSSLHKPLRAVKDPLASPRTLHAGGQRKPNIYGSNRVFSSIPQQTRGQNAHKHKPYTAGHKSGHDSGNSHDSASSKSSRYTRFKCRLLPGKSESELVFTPEYLKIGGTKFSASSVTSLEYAILEGRKSFLYTAKSKDQVHAKFILLSRDNIPFKNECTQRGIRLVNVGEKVPAVGTRIEPNDGEHSRRPEDGTCEFMATLLACEPMKDEAAIGKQITLIGNENGVLIAPHPFKSFKWDKTTFEIIDRKTHLQNPLDVHVRLKSSETVAVLNISVSNYKTLQRYINKRRTNKLVMAPFSESSKDPAGSLSPENSNSREALSSSPPKSSVKDSSHTRPNFGTIEPLNFYSSPPSRLAPFAGSKLPNAASSPKPHSRSLLPSSDASTDEAGSGSPRAKHPSIFDESLRTLRKNRVPSVTPPRMVEQPSAAPKPADAEVTEIPEKKQEQETGPEGKDPLSHRNNETPLKSPGRRPRRTRTQIDFTEDDEDDLVEPTEEDFALLKAEGYKGIDYEFWDGKHTTVGVEDIARLNPRIYVNDNIIWFFLRRYMESLVKKDTRAVDQILMLDTFFYFRMRSREDPPAWVSKMPILEKQIIIMPIHEQAHWRVAVIVGLDRLSHAVDPPSTDDPGIGHPTAEKPDGQSNALVKPTIVILDSLGPTQVYPTVSKVVKVLGTVSKVQQRPVPARSDFRWLRAAVPTQTNLTDCGVFLLHYIEQILMHLDEFLEAVAATESRVLNMRDEFWKPGELYSKRESFKRELKEMGNIEERRATPNTETPSSENSTHEQSGDEDSIEVLGMEVVKKKRRLNDEPPVTAAEKVHLSETPEASKADAAKPQGK